MITLEMFSPQRCQHHIWTRGRTTQTQLTVNLSVHWFYHVDIHKTITYLNITVTQGSRDQHPKYQESASLSSTVAPSVTHHSTGSR